MLSRLPQISISQSHLNHKRPLTILIRRYLRSRQDPNSCTCFSHPKQSSDCACFAFHPYLNAYWNRLKKSMTSNWRVGHANTCNMNRPSWIPIQHEELFIKTNTKWAVLSKNEHNMKTLHQNEDEPTSPSWNCKEELYKIASAQCQTRASWSLEFRLDAAWRGLHCWIQNKWRIWIYEKLFLRMNRTWRISHEQSKTIMP